MMPPLNMLNCFFTAYPPVDSISIACQNFYQCRRPTAASDDAKFLNNDLGRFNKLRRNKIKKRTTIYQI